VAAGMGMDTGVDNSTNNSNVLYHPPHHHHVVGSSAVAAAGMGPTVPQIPNRTPGVLCCPSLR